MSLRDVGDVRQWRVADRCCICRYGRQRCRISPEGRVAACPHVDRFAFAAQLTEDHREIYLHLLNDEQRAVHDRRNTRVIEWPGRNRHHVYSRILAALPLDRAGEAALRRIGVDESLSSFASMPDLGICGAVCAKIAPADDLMILPGFRGAAGVRVTLAARTGELLAPVRDHLSRVVAVRRLVVSDDAIEVADIIGLDAAEIHCARAEVVHENGRAFLTDDALRADSIADRTGVGCVALLTSVGRHVGSSLSERFPTLRTVLIDPVSRLRNQVAESLRIAHIDIENAA